MVVAQFVAEQERPCPPQGEVVDDSEEDDTDGDSTRAATLGWIRLTHVCSGW